MNEWVHSGIELIGIAATVFTTLWLFKRSAKADRERMHLENKKEQEKTQKSQSDLLDELLEERKWLGSHGHSERSGPLTVEGMTKRPRNGMS